MVTVHRERGLRFFIFVDDHAPAHVHVFGDGEAKVNLIGPSGEPELLWADGMTKADIRRTMRIVSAQAQFFLAQWKQIHG